MPIDHTGQYRACGSNGAVATMDLDTLAPAGTVLYTTLDGFVFTVAIVSIVSTTPFTCTAGTCQDQQVFDIAGTVSKAGFEDTNFAGNFTANGSCVEGAAGTCEGGLETGNYSSSISAGISS